MGLFDKIFGKKNTDRRPDGYWSTLTAYAPVFHNWRESLYESELCRSAIDARARNISKLRVEIIGNAQPKMKTRLQKKPNSFQTWGQFLYRLSTILDMQNTAFIVPILDEADVIGVYPILPSRCELVDFNGKPFLRYQFTNGKTASMQLEKVGIMTKFQYNDDFFGDDNTALKETMNLISLQNQGVEEAIKNSSTFRFMARLTNFSKPEDLANESKRFTEENLKSDASGLLLFPNTYSDIQKIDSKPYTIDNDQMEFIRTNVYNYFGVNEDILQNKAIGDAWNAFYEGCIEVFSIQFSDVITKMLFTDREQAGGACIMATSNRLQYMSNKDKLNVSAQLADRGLMTINEIRDIWNLAPLPDGDKTIRRGEYKDDDTQGDESDQEPDEDPDEKENEDGDNE